jgi:hypothetical protein
MTGTRTASSLDSFYPRTSVFTLETAVPSYPAPAAARRTGLLSGVTGIVVALVVGGVLSVAGVVVPTQQAVADTGATATAASQDEDIADAPFPDLSVTISQTRDLVAQGITVSWTGAKKSSVPNGENGGTDFLQIAQCWGEDPLHPGEPDRSTCQYGAFGSAGATRDNTIGDIDDVADEDLPYTVPSTYFAVPTYTSVPFRSVTGKTVASVVDGKKVQVDINQNEFFTSLTSNEVKWAGSGANGEGSAKFEIQTALQAPGLGCGTPVTAPDSSVTGQSCWLVVIPRGTADPGENSVNHSGLFWDTWKHHVAFKLDFKPLGVTCAIGAAERQIAGSELAATAVASWQPSLCSSTGGAVYTISTGTESDATSAAQGSDTAPLALTSRPAAPSESADPLVYAPIALSGAAITFAVDREPVAGEKGDPEAIARAGLPFTELNLTPRLVAKLLTNSYLSSLPVNAPKKHLGYVSATDRGHNPQNLTFDPDFLAVNDPEWAQQSISTPSLADLLEPQGRSDVAWQLWRYVLADDEAVAFLAGEPDPWGMIVNPWSSTSSTVNPSGAGLVLPRDNFPKADPAEQPATKAPATDSVNLVTWRPYTNDFDQAAYLTLRGDGQVLGAWDPTPVTGPPKYTKAGRNLVGQQRVIGLSDTASASKYQVLTASLRNAAGAFVAPDANSILAAAAAMTPTSQPSVLEYDPAGSAAQGAPTAYPLAMPVYAAADRSVTDDAVRADYATFIRYAATAGQEPGTTAGQLPGGYAPLPQSWRDQALLAADAIQSGPVVPSVANTTPAAGTAGASSGRVAPGTLATPPAAATVPSASGDAVTVLSGPATPKDASTGPVAAAVPMSLLSGSAAALAVPFLTRIRRRV